MKKHKLLENIGFALFILGFILMLLDSVKGIAWLSPITKEHQIFYWVGLALWALGYMQRKKHEKTEG